MSGPGRRVVVTGMGAICGAGLDADAVVVSAMAGRSAMRTITRFDPHLHMTRIAAEVPLPLTEGVDPVVAWGMRAAHEAVRHAALGQGGDSSRIGVLVGSALGGVPYRDVSMASAEPGALTLASQIARMVGATGPVLAISSAFAASVDAIGIARERIRSGELDMVIAGGAEAPITPVILAGFASMGALSSDNEHPEQAVKPFDLNRDGCGLGEGAAFLVLEERELSLARGAPILAELAGYSATADAVHITSLPDDGEGLVRAMRGALDDTGVFPDEVGYINAHGTGTAMNDRVETRAIRTVFGEHASMLGISSTKPVTGHLLGAAGAMEAVISIGALRQGMMPPTVNWTTRDPDCELDYVPEGARPADLRVVMSNSMGFGGHNAVLVFREAP